MILQAISQFSDRLTRLPTRLLYLVPFYGILILAVTLVERNVGYATGGTDSDLGVDESTKLLFPDARQNYTASDLGEFYKGIEGSGRKWYLNYLLLQTPLLALWTLFVIWTLSAVTVPLVHAERQLVAPVDVSRNLGPSAPGELSSAPSNAPSRSQGAASSEIRGAASSANPVPATLLNLVPFMIALFDLAEKILLLLTMYLYDSKDSNPLFTSSAQAASRATSAKWLVTRLSFTLIFVTITSGWGRIIITRLKAGKPAFPAQPQPLQYPPLRPGSDKLPRGLTPVNMLSEKTWKSNDGEMVNNKKKKT
ncbi:hypothetical protein DFS34DRAFT_589362 [Phlyctochytrium arcticum]|nr:hypothetical protein DFS34DRAFT_589362 [Phlyctochytrium arcticum]